MGFTDMDNIEAFKKVLKVGRPYLYDIEEQVQRLRDSGYGDVEFRLVVHEGQVTTLTFLEKVKVDKRKYSLQKSKV